LDICQFVYELYLFPGGISMSKVISGNRRNFLKASALSAAGFAIIGPMGRKARAAGTQINTTLVNLSTTPINQEVDNLRVAFITDSSMFYSTANPMPYPGWDILNNPSNKTNGLNYAVVQSNLDKLACALTGKTNPSDAWPLLLKIPASKTWPTAKAAIKLNASFGDNPNIPIVAKICRVLVGFGMPAGNITLYDANGNGNIGMYNNTSYIGSDSKLIPTGVVFGPGGGHYPNTIVFPASAGGESIGVTDTVDGVDILVNIAVNKGHDQFDEYSGVTMCQKNHKGTIIFSCNDGNKGLGIQHLVNVNSCDYIAGKIPSAYPAKQQLCIVDSLWFGINNTYTGLCNDGKNGNSIVMGTFPGAVDYVATMKIRIAKYAATTWNQPIVDKFVTGYGYADAAKTTVMTSVAANVAGPGLVDASGIITSTLPEENKDLTRQNSVQISVSGNGIRPFNTSLSLSKGETVQSAEIFSVQGRKVRTVALNSGSNRIFWDGRTDSGSLAKTGNYVVRIRGQKSVISGDVALNR
jgi:hypothetical protein